MRLNKFIAMSGYCSRRKADELILHGLVKVDGKIINKLGLRINPEIQRVTVDDKLIKPPKRNIYMAFNKPKGVITTMNDPLNRESIYHYLTDMPKVFPIGRLDKESEGLLILTNDGELANILMHPRFKLEKTYVVTINGNPTDDEIKRLEKGIFIEGKKTLPCQIKLLRDYGDKKEFLIKMREGKKRQIRNMFFKVGCEVKKLVRVSIGNIKLGNLKPGTFRIIGEKEIAELKKIIENTKEHNPNKKTQFYHHKI